MTGRTMVCLAAAFSMSIASAHAQKPRKQTSTKASEVGKVTATANVLVPFGPISKVVDGRATAAKPGKQISFKVTVPSGDEAPRSGLLVLLSLDGKTAAYTRFPLRIPFAKDCVGEGPGHGCFRMETKDAKVSITGLITGRTHTISEDVLEGFTGQVWVHLLDRNGNPLAIRRAGCFGVNMRQGRNDVWSVQIPSDTVGMAARAEIWHARSGCSRDRWNEVLEKAKKGAEVIGALMKQSTDSTSTTTEPKQ